MTTDLVPQQTKKQVLMVQQKANAFVVQNPDDMEAGAGLLRSIKDVEDGVTARKEEITRPLMKSLASVRDLFKPLELGLADAKKVIKAKLLAFQIEQEERIEKEKAKVLARIGKGTMRADTGASKLAVIGDAPKTKGVQIRKLIKVKIEDETAIPREYLMPDMAKITEAVLHQGIDIPGVLRYEEKSLASV